MSSERIALLTYNEEPELADSEALLPEAFAKEGIEAKAAPWDGNVNWQEFNTIILRACWNYHLKRDEFITWLGNQAAEGKTIWNPLETIKWNTDKHYLLDLEKRGVKIIPSDILEPDDDRSLVKVLSSKKWETGVIKPTIGASAFNVQKFDEQTAEEIESKLDRSRPWIVQKFCPEINTEGEYSLMFFDRIYSHSVIKKPKDSDFRTQPHYGGAEWEVEPQEKVIEQVSTILDKIGGPILYARVDGLLLDGVFHLMELELTEPYLFLGSHPDAPRRFVDAYKALAH